MNSISKTSYNDYLKNKIKFVEESGIDVSITDLHSILFDYQKYLVKWALKMGKCALFTSTGTGKTLMQCEYARQIILKENINCLICAPLAVNEQTIQEALKIGLTINNLRHNEHKPGCNIINYEQLHNIDDSLYDCIILDESSILKNFTSKTKQLIIDKFSNTKYKLACSATPAPNDFMELGNHAEFLNVMSRKEMLSMYFIHDSAHTQSWRLKGHAEDIFWKWLSSWAAIMTKPSDLGFSDDNYKLPNLNIINQVIDTDVDINNQATLFLKKKQKALSLSERQKVRRLTTEDRVQVASDIVNKSDDIFLVWCDLNYESNKLAKLVNNNFEVTGSDSIEFKEKTMLNFSKGDIKCLISKPSICGHGMNWQVCHNMIFVGLSDSFEQYFQAIRRCWRFGQKKDVNVTIITSSQEGAVLENIQRKEKQANEMISNMVEHTRKYVIENIKHVHKPKGINEHNKILIKPNFI